MLLVACSAPRHPASDGVGLFNVACGQCHSLIGNESLRRPGGDLLGYHFSRVELVSFAREMPVRRRLSRSQLAAIVAYVLSAQRSAR